MQLRQLPNAITLLRLLLALPVGWMLWQQSYQQALLLFAIAAVSDGVDGFLARTFSWQSRFGAIVDPLADKLLLTVAYLGLAVHQVLPWWLVLLVIGRDIVIVSGAVSYHLLFGKYRMQPSLAGKLCTLCQLLLVALMLLHTSGVWVQPEERLWVSVQVVALVTLASGLDYIVTWGLKAWRQGRKQP